jgi:3'-phosphoadenosine 5'-phosphosulfate sulfotransferase (PAPS reductase)/FAD synthetase
MTLTIASWGGGVNSTAMVVEWLSRRERLDFVLFADTGGEKPTTYAYLETFAEWLEKHDVTFIRLKANVQDDTLEDECLRTKLASLPRPL